MCNPDRKCKVVLVSDNMIFESISNKKGNQEVTELFIGVMKINISTFLSQFF